MLVLALDNELLLAIPLFLLCGSIIGKGAIADRLIAIMSALIAPLAGGLGVATVLTCAVFAAVSGSSAVNLLAIIRRCWRKVAASISRLGPSCQAERWVLSCLHPFPLSCSE